MTRDLHAMLVGWLESPIDARRLHARARLAMPDAARFRDGVAPDSPTSPPIFALHPDDTLVRLRGLRACPYGGPAPAGCCNQLATVCHWKGKLIMAFDCIDCLKGL